MAEIQQIIDFLDDHLEKNNLDRITPTEANELLNGAGLLEDNPKRLGAPLRALLRDGVIPHAFKEGRNWFIPHSKPGTASVEKEERVETAQNVKKEETVEEQVEVANEGPTRMKIGLRLIYTVLFLLIFEVLKLVVQVTTLVNYIFLFATKKPNEPLRNFGNKVSAYAYRVLRYVTLNENTRPFPFSNFPQEQDLPEEKVDFE